MAFLSSFKLAIGGTVLMMLLGAGVHYRIVLNQRDDLRIEKISFQITITRAAESIAAYEANAILQREATATAIADRNAAAAAVRTLREGRNDDAESMVWGAQLIPQDERDRLCVALPEMEGCVN